MELHPIKHLGLISQAYCSLNPTFKPLWSILHIRSLSIGIWRFWYSKMQSKMIHEWFSKVDRSSIEDSYPITWMDNCQSSSLIGSTNPFFGCPPRCTKVTHLLGHGDVQLHIQIDSQRSWRMPFLLPSRSLDCKSTLCQVFLQVRYRPYHSTHSTWWNFAIKYTNVHRKPIRVSHPGCTRSIAKEAFVEDYIVAWARR